MINKTEKFKLRKSKKYKNLVSIGIGVVSAVAIGVASDNEAHASDQGSSATNSNIIQVPPSKEQANNLANENKAEGTVEVKIDNSSVNMAVEKAKSEGVNVVEKTKDLGVTTSTTETITKQNEAMAENKKQENNINKVTNNYKVEKENYSKQLDTVNAENKEKEDKYKKDIENYNKEKDRITKENKKIEEENSRKTEDYNNKLNDVNKENEKIKQKNKERTEEFNRNLEKYNKEIAEVEKEKEKIKTTKPLLVRKDGIAVYGNYRFDKTKSNEYFSDLVVVNETNEEMADIIDFIGMHKDSKVELHIKNEVKDKDGTYFLLNPIVGDYYYLKNIATMRNGDKLSAKVTFIDLGENFGEVINGKAVTKPIVTINKGGGGFATVVSNHSRVSQKYEFYNERTNKKVNILAAVIIGDVDWGQAGKMEFNKSKGIILNPPGSELTLKNGNELWSPRLMGADGEISIPLGTYVSVGYGDTITYTHIAGAEMPNPKKYDSEAKAEEGKTDIPGSYGYGIFGKSVELSKVRTPIRPSLKKEEEKPLPEKPVLEKLKEEPPKPPKPTYTSIPKELTPPTVEYTVFRLAEQPRLMKETRNEENIDINGSLVNKQATVKFELKTDELPAGREELSILEFTDTLPQGYVINEDVVKKNNSALGYLTTYNKESHTVVFTATKALLNSLNKDVSKVVKVVAPIITGTVTNDGGTYKNNFKLNLNNKYTRYSNVVIVSTPPESTPNKVNNDEDENNIDGKVVVAGTTNYYKLLWDLDQYKGMKVSKKDIAKGFFYIDDYPEEAVTINSSGIHVIDNKGHAVVGVEVVKYDSLEVAPQEIKTLLAKTKIAPKGAFQVFKATNPEDFFNRYVVTGSSIKITNPMVVKDELKATGGKYENRAYQIDFENGYATEIITNTVPKPEPTKHNKNENDVIVDGKVIAPETVNNYTLLWDLDQYKGIVATHKEVAKGFFFVEDYPEEAVKIDNLKTTMIDSKGHEVIGVEITSYDSLEKAPEEVRTMLKEAKISPRGAFQLFKATNSEEFYNNYVKNGVSITIISPMTIIDSVNKNGGEFSNKAYQVDFGIGYETETVTNRVPRTNPEKHNYNEDGVLIDGGLVPVGTVTDYKLTWKLSDLKDTVASREKIKDGFYFVEDYPEVVETMNDKIKILDSNGQEVKGIKATNFTDINKVSDKLKTILAKNNIMPKGAFQVFEAENPEEFYNKYVKAGIDLTIINPMRVKEDLKETGGKYENKAYEIDFGIGQATSTVENTVPKVEPVKHNYNEDNLVIDGKVVLAASSNRYKLLWDLSEYKNIEVPDKYVEKGFYFVDDYPEEALKLEDSKITMIDSKGEKVTGVEVENYDSLEKAPEEVRTMLKEAKVTPKGSFQLFKATNSKEFYNKYVKTGNSITITNPMIVKEEMARNTKHTDNIIREKEDVGNRLNNSITKLSNEISTDKPTKEEVKPIVPNNRENVTNKEVNTTTSNENEVVKPSNEKDGKNEKVTINGSSYENRAYQIDFGQGYRTNVVVNNVPKIEPKKDVVIDVKTTESVDGKELELNKIFNYRLIGTKIPNNRGTKLTEYGFNDDYDETADKYQGNYRVFAMNNIKLKDGTEIREDSELTKFTTQVFNVKEGKVEIEFDKDFLDKVDLNSEFQAEVYLQMERIKAGEIENVFTHTVNKVAVESNKVKTITKEKEIEKPKPEPKPTPTPNVEKPKPEPKKEEPQVKQKLEVEKTPIPQSVSNSKMLPNTQADNDSGATTGIMLGALAMAGLIAKRKKVNN